MLVVGAVLKFHVPSIVDCMEITGQEAAGLLQISLRSLQFHFKDLHLDPPDS